MKRGKITVFMVIALVSLITSLGFYLSVDGDRAPGQVGTSNNPIVVSGPVLESSAGTINESFEAVTFPPVGWIKITPTGGTGWERQTNNTTPVPGFNGGTLFAPPGGGTAMAFCNYLTGGTTTANQWLITPQITNVQPGDSLTFWLRKFGNYIENFAVKISTTTPTVAAMTVTVANMTFAAADSGYIQYKYQIGSLVPAGSNIYIGFNENVSNTNIDGASFSMDLVRVTGTISGISQTSGEVPSTYSLAQNYPNPFNPSTTIKFSVPTTGNVKLSVMDAAGREVAQLVNSELKTGNYEFNFDASKLTTGVYFYRLQGNNFLETKKMLLIK